jgi:hypothetical protein
LLRGKILTAESGAYIITGFDADLRRMRTLICASFNLYPAIGGIPGLYTALSGTLDPMKPALTGSQTLDVALEGEPDVSTAIEGEADIGPAVTGTPDMRDCT